MLQKLKTNAKTWTTPLIRSSHMNPQMTSHNIGPIKDPLPNHLKVLLDVKGEISREFLSLLQAADTLE